MDEHGKEMVGVNILLIQEEESVTAHAKNAVGTPTDRADLLRPRGAHVQLVLAGGSLSQHQLLDAGDR